MIFHMPTSTPIKIEYPGRCELKRVFGRNNRTSERIRMNYPLLPPGISLRASRTIQYYGQFDQPRISEIVADLTAKIGVPPLQITTVRQKYRRQFANGVQVLDSADQEHECYEYIGKGHDETGIKNINENGRRDVAPIIEFGTGISGDRAKRIQFALWDNEHGKGQS
ncbi:hypothetical protein [Paracoccus sp. FO-3]|nr:hypothetical protein [Paracoccus sp. FO-3]